LKKKMTKVILRKKPYSSIFLLAAWALGLALIMLVNSRASAQEGTPNPSDDAVNTVAKQLYCPVCENISLDVCPTQACAEWRELIRQKLAEGWSAEQIEEYFALQYGDRVLAEPPRRGLNWLVYVLPPLFILGGAVILIRILRRMRKPGAAQVQKISPLPTAINDRYLGMLEDELKRRE
jgi:cytochrome c-type biogenesis protein CcmH